MAKRVIHVGFDSLDDMGRHFVETWHRAERGETVEPYYGLDFEDMVTMLATLTPKRWALLRYLRQHGPMSVYGLAKALERDYKRVHSDVKVLAELMLIEKDEGNRVYVPWDEIEAHIRLAA